MNFLKQKQTLVISILCIFTCLWIFACKSANESASTSTNGDTVSVAKDDLEETSEDLLAVDYKEFYDDLAPHGEWIEVNGDEVGIEVKKSSSKRNPKDDALPTISIAALFGVSDAYADLSASTFFIWKPAPSLAVGITAGEPEVDPVPVPTPAYVPYTNGEWVSTTQGWYFRAATPQEEIVHHYGRWMNSPALGWVWIPGRVQSPAWVEWREDDENIAWTPIPPNVYIVNNVIPEPQVTVIENNYVVVPKKYFVEPQVYRYFYPETRIKVKGMKPIKGIVIQDRVIYNNGPALTVIETISGRRIEPLTIVSVNNFRDVKVKGNEITLFSPNFKKVKIKKDKYEPVTKPQNFVKYSDAKENYKKRNEAASDFNKQENKGKDEENLNKQKNLKLQDDSDMRKGKQKENKEKIRKEEPKPKKENKEQPKVKERKENPKKDGGNDKEKDKGGKDKKK